MRVLVITPFFYPHIGGSQQYMEDLYSEMIKQQKDLKVDIVCYNTIHAKSFEKYRGMHVYRFPCWSILPGQFVVPKPQILKLLTTIHQYDLVHCSTRFFESSWWIPVLAKLNKKTVILTDHCAFFPVSRSRFVNLIAKVIDLTIDKTILSFYNQIFVSNKATQRFLNKYLHRKSRVIYGGVNTKIFYPKNKKLSKKIVILFVGRMIQSKGVLELFESVKDLTQTKVLFVGPGPLAKQLKSELSVGKVAHIKILGPKNKREVAKLMRGSDILVHPSYHHEGFPNVLLEAGASRLAVIATDVGGSKEIINKKTGLLIKPHDQLSLKKSLQKLVRSDTQRRAFSNNLYQYVLNNFTWEKIARQQYRELTRLLCENGKQVR